MTENTLTTADYEAGQIILIDKPLNWTSFDVVKKVRYLLKKKYGFKKLKVGHAGTLDPLASGLLILCTGKFTKRIGEIQAASKLYTGTFTLGATTPSFDLETAVNETFPTEHITETALSKAAKALTGKLDQVPPLFSAKQVNGVRAYELARTGSNHVLKANAVEVFSFKLHKINLPEVHFEIHCSKGTYIRSLARDFGLELNSGAYLSELRRTAIGDYKIEDAQSIEEFTKDFE